MTPDEHLCECAKPLWTTVENPQKPVDNLARAGDSMPETSDKAFTGSSTPREETAAAVLDALDALKAQLDAVEARLARLEIARFTSERSAPATPDRGRSNT